MARKKPRNYVNNPEFLEALVAYDKLCKQAELDGEEKPIVPKYIGECLYQIATRLATKPNFSGYTYKDEFIADGLENTILALKNFDPNKSTNPFAYFSQIIWYAFLRRIEKEKKEQYIRYKVVENSMVQGTIINKKQGEAGEASFVDLNNDYRNDFVSTYERKLEEKRIKTAKSKKGLEKFVEEKNVLDVEEDPTPSDL